MNWKRGAFFLIATAMCLALLVAAMSALLALREKAERKTEETLPAPVLALNTPPKSTGFPDDFGRLDALTPSPVSTAMPLTAPETGTDQTQDQDQKPAALAVHTPEFRDAAWLRAQNPDAFTLQIMAARDENAVKRFLVSRDDYARYNYFLYAQDGALWYVVTTGNYASMEQARGVADSTDFGLPTRPFPRRFGLYLKTLTAPPAPVPPTSVSPAPASTTPTSAPTPAASTPAPVPASAPAPALEVSPAASASMAPASSPITPAASATPNLPNADTHSRTAE
jgi:hypothetical protein